MRDANPMSIASRAFAVLALSLATACGGGSGSPAISALGSTPSLTGSGTAATMAAQTGTITLSFPIPSRTSGSAHVRAPQYVSPNTASITITVVSVNGSTTLPAGVPSPTTVQLSSAPGGNCTVTFGLESCVIPIPTPPGTVVYHLVLQSATGAILSENTVTETIAAGTSGANFPVQLLGLVAGVTVAPPQLVAGTPFSGTLMITSNDASGAPITGSTSFFQPYTLTDNDTSGATSLSVNGGPPMQSVTVTSPTEVVTLNYSGQAITPFTFTVSGASIPPGSTTAGTEAPQTTAIQFTGTLLDTAATGGVPTDVNWQQSTLFFDSIGQSESFSVSQAGQSSFSVALDPATCGGSPAVVTVHTTNNVTFNVTANANGICKATVTGSPGVTQSLWFSSTTGSFAVN
jgi:hypothetical protein